MSVVEERTAVACPKPQCADAVLVVYAEQVIRFIQAGVGRHLAGPLVPFETALHEHAAPAVGAGVGEHAETLAGERILRAREESQARVQRQGAELRVEQCFAVVFEGQQFTAGAAAGVEMTQAPGRAQALPIGIDSNRRVHREGFAGLRSRAESSLALMVRGASASAGAVSSVGGAGARAFFAAGVATA